jgi:hypothetical protein
MRAAAEFCRSAAWLWTVSLTSGGISRAARASCSVAEHALNPLGRGIDEAVAQEGSMNDFVAGDRYSKNINTRALLTQHWAAMESGNLDVEHDVYHAHAVLDYPQSGETIVGSDNIRASRLAGPRRSDLKVKAVLGQDDLWVTEYTVAEDGVPKLAVSIMEFRDGKVIRETLYFTDRVAAPAWRAQWVSKQTG